MSVAFSPLSLSIGDYGLFWSEIMDEFPASEALEPVAGELESFDGLRPTQIGIQIIPAGSLPRAAFRNVAAGELVQVQPDRFGFNWIKTSDEHRYPHSEKTLDRFFGLFQRFAAFAQKRNLGTIKITQCELTNVNVVPVSDVGQSLTDMATVFRLATVEPESDQLRLENQMMGSKHLILGDNGQPIGRVHSLGQPALRVPNNEEAYRLDIVARGAPLGEGIEGAQKFFDAAVSAVNAVFLANITKAGRQFWGEHNG